MIDIENEHNNDRSDRLEVNLKNRKPAKIRRTDNEIQDDILKYNELLLRDKGLELDIPPKRTKTSRNEQTRMHCDKKSSRTSRYRNRRLALDVNTPKELPLFNSKVSLNNIKKNTDEYKILKPKYFSKRRVETPRYESHYEMDEIRPPLLTETKRFNTFESKTLLTNSYQELIKLVKSEINCQDSKEDGNDIGESIDISLQWKLFPKNIEFEKKRFDIKDLHYFDFQSQNVMLTTNLFCSEDIDLFFQRLNDNSNFEQFNDADGQFNPDSSIKDYLKKTIPLA